jgi:hypothetical protein
MECEELATTTRAIRLHVEKPSYAVLFKVFDGAD